MPDPDHIDRVFAAAYRTLARTASIKTERRNVDPQDDPLLRWRAGMPKAERGKKNLDDNIMKVSGTHTLTVVAAEQQSADWARYLEKRVTGKVLDQLCVFRMIDHDVHAQLIASERKLARQRLEDGIAELRAEFDLRVSGLQAEIDKLRGLAGDRGAEIVELPPFVGRRHDAA